MRQVTFQVGTKEHSERSRPLSKPNPIHDDSSSFENDQTVIPDDTSNSPTKSIINSDEEAKNVQEQIVMREPFQEIIDLNQAIRAVSIHHTQENLICATCQCDMEPGHSYFKCASCDASSHTTCVIKQTECC